MASRRLLALTAFLFTLNQSVVAQTGLETREENVFKRAVALVAPSLVRIDTIGGLDRIDQVLTGTGPTTGLIVSPDGYIISSSFNFAGQPSSILVTLPDGRRLPANQIATDKLRMLTLLKVEAENLLVPQAAPADTFRVGQWTLAVGKTYSDEFPNVSLGILSAKERIWGKALQTDSKTSPTNYGGPLVDIQGRVLGLIVPLSPQANGEVAGVEWYDSGIGFAIPFVDALSALERLKQGENLLPGLMGVAFKGQNIYDGVPIIDRVRFGSPASKVGIKVGDKIVEMDGKSIIRQAQIRHVLGNKYSGEDVAVVVEREGQKHPYTMTLVGELPPYESAYLGILPLRHTSDQSGVTVRYVYANSPAQKAGIQEGDQILKWNETELANSTLLVDFVGRIRPEEQVKLTIKRAEETKVLDVKVGKIPEEIPAELAREFIPAPAEKPDPKKVGRLTSKLPGHDPEYWAYVPEDYNASSKYGLVVWLHPGGDTMEATLVKNWRIAADQRGFILLGPKASQIAGWQPNDMDFIKALIEHFTKEYNIDKSRIIVHGHGNGGTFAYQLAFKHRDLIRGVITTSAPFPTPPPDNEPDYRLQLLLLSGSKDPQLAPIKATVQGLKAARYPVIHREIPDWDQRYPEELDLEESLRWIDSLDRI